MDIRKYSILAVLCCICLAFSFSSCKEDKDDTPNTSQENTPNTSQENTLSGKIYDIKTKAPVEGAHVSCYLDSNNAGSKDKILISSQIAENGEFCFRDLNLGERIYLEVSADGYLLYTETVSVINKTSLVIELEPRGNSENVIDNNSITITPTLVNLGSDVTQSAIKLYNHTSENLQFTITDYPSFVTISPSASVVEANGIQTIIFSYNQAASSNTNKVCRLNIGGNSYPVTINYSTGKIMNDADVDESSLIGTWYLQYFTDNYGDGLYCDWGEYMTFRNNGTLVWNNRLYNTNTTYKYTRTGNTIICKCTYAQSPDWDASHFNMTLRIESLTSTTLVTYDTDEENLHRHFKKK